MKIILTEEQLKKAIKSVSNDFENFAETRMGGAKKISDNAKEKGGLSLLTYHHFVVKLPYYKKASEGKLTKDAMEKEGKEIIDMATLNYCIQAADIIKNDPEMSKLMALAPTDFDNVEVYNEQEFSYDMENHAFKGIKGIIDNLVIDHERKVIFINDLKTTSKELKDFRECHHGRSPE